MKWIKRNGLNLSAFIAVVFSLTCLVYVLSRIGSFTFQESLNNVKTDKKSTPLGDTFNGITAPFIMLVTAGLTYLAFLVQSRANKIQVKNFKKQIIIQKKQSEIEKFENKYYELIRLHKENLQETQIKGYGERTVELRKAFVSMYKELRYVYFVVHSEYNKLIETKTDLPKVPSNLEEKKVHFLNLSYIFFYTGVGIHSNVINEEMTKNKFDFQLVDVVKKRLEHIHRDHSNYTSKANFWHRKENYDELTISIKELGEALLPKSYRPFSGHMSRLGHYYRHLFQTVKFVDEHKLLKPKKKIKYLQTLRAQLSDHEQVLLFLNAASSFGHLWIEKQYFSKYKMIHNMPLPLVKFADVINETLKVDERFENRNGNYWVQVANGKRTLLFEYQE